MVKKMLNFSKAEDVPGWIKSSQIQLIQNIAKNLPDGSKVLEIGSGYGRSTWAWLDGLDNSCTLDIVDSWQLDLDRLNLVTDDKEVLDFGKCYGQKKLFEKIISCHPRYNLLQNVFNEKTKKLIKSKTLSKNYTVVYFDGDHTHDNLYNELCYFAHADILCGDDYNFEKFRSVVDAVNRFIYHFGLGTDSYSDRLLEVDRASLFWKISYRK